MKKISGESFGNTAGTTLRENSLPIALIGLGAGLLAYKRYAGKSQPKSVNSTAAQLTDGTSASLTEKVTGFTSTAYDKVSGLVETAYSGATDAVGKAYDKIDDAGSDLRERYETQIEEHPLALGAVAVALGVAVGMSIPSTYYEGELLGGARKDLIEKAQSAATAMIDKTKDAFTGTDSHF